MPLEFATGKAEVSGLMLPESMLPLDHESSEGLKLYALCTGGPERSIVLPDQNVGLMPSYSGLGNYVDSTIYETLAVLPGNARVWG